MYQGPRTAQLERLCDNLINGNLTDAKRQAKRFSQVHIAVMLFFQYGHSKTKASLGAGYLKGRADLWQKYCDAK